MADELLLREGLRVQGDSRTTAKQSGSQAAGQTPPASETPAQTEDQGQPAPETPAQQAAEACCCNFIKPSFMHFSTAPGGGGLCLESGTSQQQPGEGFSVKGKQGPEVAEASEGGGGGSRQDHQRQREIGRASCRERV